MSNVRFDRGPDDWMMATVQISPERNPLPDARDEDYMDDVLLTLTLCYKVKNPAEGQSPLSFYRSTVRMVSIEQSKRYSLYFFLPGVIRDRDELDVEPFAWMVEMEVSGTKVGMSLDQAGGEVQKDKEGYDNFLSQASSGVQENEGLLVPVYLAPNHIVDSSRLRYTEVPAFYRFEPEN
ncbi:hypothetical protein [Puniceicoccus vermicola]|uniref:Uncharacterized protein n=1 Tax=Puniceicoccus vermicola TaxID=388746 RepID=A0A7X1AWU8_9BACT|nr:hypothetical protein [Puniceicoccus vermicola]MBC2601466.1 hypothetical protein [Puniceicoccus vermicola]